MTRDETIALFLKGKDEWNRWAEGMLAERKALEEAGDWAAETDFLGGLEGSNDKTKDWIARACADFSRCRVVKAGAEARTAVRDGGWAEGGVPVKEIEVTDSFDCSGFIFPGTADFISVRFHTDTSFIRATYHATADFICASFHANAEFNDAQFHSEAVGFDRARFHGNAHFRRAQFHEMVCFDSAAFEATADFGSAQFLADTDFTRAQFHADVWFDRACFRAQVAFYRAKFAGPVYFFSSTFKKGGDFRFIRSEIGFDLSDARFGRVPDFTHAMLHRDLRLDNLTVRRGSIVGPVRSDDGSKGWQHWIPFLWLIRRHVDPDAPEKFRELKRFAIQGEDHRSELQFHAHEIRTARFVNDCPHQPRFWFGIGYELLSNFGRSILRPALAWGVLVTVFAGIYLGISADLNDRAPDYRSLAPYGGTQPCLSAPADADGKVRALPPEIAATTSASAESWSLALKNGFVFIDWDRAEAARRTYGCPFGLISDGGNTYPVVPRAVSIWGLIQNVLSAVLIFLLLLGIRNLLKLK
jgi:hypothetical protein